MPQKILKVTEAKQVILGLCPKCLNDRGIESNIILISYTDKESGKHHEFGACVIKKEHGCGYTCTTRNGKRVTAICPNCNSDRMKAVTKQDGSNKFKCENCNDWFTADEDFNLVEPPECPKCGQNMIHKSKKAKPDEFFWACFDCSIFSESDKYGAIAEVEATEKSEHTIINNTNNVNNNNNDNQNNDEDNSDNDYEDEDTVD